MSDTTDMLERFRRGAELLATLTTGAAGPELDWTPAPGKWSVRQIVCHIADTELVAGVRIRKVLAEDGPRLEAFDQDAWAERLDYGRRKLSQTIETFRRLRSENYDLLKDLPEEAFQRTGLHAERGPVTLRDLVQGFAAHVEEHAQHVRARRAEYKQFRMAPGH